MIPYQQKSVEKLEKEPECRANVDISKMEPRVDID